MAKPQRKDEVQAELPAVETPAPTVTVAPVAPVIAIRKGIPLPTRSARAGRTEKYPFDKLEAPVVVDGQTVYASFPVFKIAKNMQSTVYSATKRYLNEDGSKSREFKCFDVDPTTDPDNAVARVFRIA